MNDTTTAKCATTAEMKGEWHTIRAAGRAIRPRLVLVNLQMPVMVIIYSSLFAHRQYYRSDASSRSIGAHPVFLAMPDLGTALLEAW